MQKEFLPKAEQFLKQNKRRSIWRKIVKAMACVVVFCTTYALILPAITLERTTCELEEHTHSDSCYIRHTSREQTSLVCSYEILGVHTHTGQCRDAEQNLICGMADFVLHSHDASCFNQDGTLICLLPEVGEHLHSETCYQAPETEEHIHGDECYTIHPGQLLCELEEFEGHFHTDACMTRGELICDREELEGHVHGEDCHISVLNCGQEESEVHTHGEDCYISVPNCDREEREGHTHGDDCYESITTCDQEETEGHFHQDACYEQIRELTCQPEEPEPPEPILICPMQEITPHTHREGSCYESGRSPVCGQIAVEEHIHAEGCFMTETVPLENADAQTCGLEEDESHSHTDRCYGVWELICGKEEHTHTPTYSTGLSGPVGYAYRGSSSMLFSTPRSDDSKTYHTDIEPLLSRIIILDSSDNLVYDSSDPAGSSNTVHVGEQCRIILYFKENTSNQFSTDGAGILTYQIPANLSSEIVDSGVIKNRDNQDVATYTINHNELVITPVMINGGNFFGKYNDVTLEIELDAEVIQTSDSDYTEIKFDNNHKVDILVQEDGTLVPSKKQLHYDQGSQTITYECKATAMGGTVSLDYIDDWWWPDNMSVLQDSIQLTDAQGNDITDSWTYEEWGTYFKLTPQSSITLKHGESVTLTYQIQLKEGIKQNFEFNNTFAVHGRFGDESLYAETTTSSFIEFTNVDKTGIYVPLGENGTVQNALEWMVDIDNSDLEQITITDRLGPGQTYCEHKPLYIYGIRSDGTAKEFNIAWENVDRNEANNMFTLALPTEELGDGRYEFAEYMLIYYSHYTLDENGPDVQYFENTVETNIMVGDKPTGDTATVGVLGVPPGIQKEVTAADDQWLTFTVECFMPANLYNRTPILLYDTLASWGNIAGYIQQNPDSLTITVTPEEGEAYELQPYPGQGSADNTYLLAPDGQSFTIYFNTSETTAATSTWKCPVNSMMTVTYRVSMDSPMLDGWGGNPNGETLREFLDRTGQNVNNEAQLDYSPTDKVKASVVWVPPKVPDPHLRKTATATQADGVYDYSVWFDTGDPYECIFKADYYQLDTGEWYEKNDVLSLNLTDTFDSRMEYVPGSLKVTIWDAWDHSKAIQVYRLADGKVPDITTAGDTTTMVVSAADLMASDRYEQWLSNRTLLYAMEYLRGGYQYEFTYQLRVKEEVKESTTEDILELDNTAYLNWTDSDGPQTVDPAPNRVAYDTGILQKDMLPIENSNLVRFTILINHNALDLAADGDTYLMSDTMSPNLALLYNTLTVEVLNEETGEIEGVLTPADCHFAYNPDENKMTLVLPDQRVIRVNYNCVVHGTGGETVQIHNTVEVEGRSALQDVVDSRFQILDHQGSADASSEAFYLQKQDGTNYRVLAGVTFHLYGDVKSDTPEDYIVVDGKIFYRYTSHTTGSNGIAYIDDSQLTAGHLYILKEESPPDGYVALEKPFMFYMNERPPGGSMEIPCVVNGELVVIQNFPVGYELPATGGAGTTSYTMGGLLLMMAVAIPLYIHSSKRRKEDEPSF